jgi:hypothetical protein
MGLFSAVLVVVLPAMTVAIETGKEEIRVGVMRVFLARLAGGGPSRTINCPGLQDGIIGSAGSRSVGHSSCLIVSSTYLFNNGRLVDLSQFARFKIDNENVAIRAADNQIQTILV